MYLKCNRRIKDGKEHRYWSIVESRRCGGGKTVQRPVLYLGEINDSQREAWIRTIEVFDEDRGKQGRLALFSADREIPASVADGIGVRLWSSCSRGRGSGVPAGSLANYGSNWICGSFGGKSWDVRGKAPTGSMCSKCS